jgi:hypothetical protein
MRSLRAGCSGPGRTRPGAKPAWGRSRRARRVTARSPTSSPPALTGSTSPPGPATVMSVRPGTAVATSCAAARTPPGNGWTRSSIRISHPLWRAPPLNAKTPVEAWGFRSTATGIRIRVSGPESRFVQQVPVSRSPLVNAPSTRSPVKRRSIAAGWQSLQCAYASPLPLRGCVYAPHPRHTPW